MRSGYINKWHTLTAAIIVQFAAGLGYSFSLYSDDLKQRFGCGHASLPSAHTLAAATALSIRKVEKRKTLALNLVPKAITCSRTRTPFGKEGRRRIPVNLE
jgi:hypothetical protein